MRLKQSDWPPAAIDYAAASIEESENRRILDEIRWTTFLLEVQQFAPEARFSNMVHDHVVMEHVDPEDPHFKRHLEAFEAGVDVDCGEPICLVYQVHNR